MDRQSEKTNQHVKTALQIYCNYQQNDWAEWLPIVQYVINARPSATMKQTPYELWMGFVPRAHQANCISNIPMIEARKEQIKQARRQALEAIKRAQELLGHESRHKPYQKGQKVWLEGTNLLTTLQLSNCNQRGMVHSKSLKSSGQLHTGWIFQYSGRSIMRSMEISCCLIMKPRSMGEILLNRLPN
jgi:hypothetical protein